MDYGRRVAVKAPEGAFSVEVTGGREEHGALRAWNEGVVAGADWVEVDQLAESGVGNFASGEAADVRVDVGIRLMRETQKLTRYRSRKRGMVKGKLETTPLNLSLMTLIFSLHDRDVLGSGSVGDGHPPVVEECLGFEEDAFGVEEEHGNIKFV